MCALLAATGAGLLSACSEAQVTHPPASSQTPFQLGSLPPIGYNHRYGNNPVAAADGFALERSLYAQKQFWEVGLRTDPANAGFVEETDPTATKAARAGFTGVLMIIASESLPTLRALVALGDKGQQAYCQHLLDTLRGEGYTGLTTATVLVFFGESDRHASLNWTPQGSKYTIYDNNLNGALNTPIPTATLFNTPPPH